MRGPRQLGCGQRNRVARALLVLVVVVLVLVTAGACGSPEPIAADSVEAPPPPEPALPHERGHTDFARAFTDGAAFLDPEAGRTLVSEVRQVGELTLTSGELMVADPSYLLDEEPDWYEHPVPGRAPIGTWPVEVALVRDEGSAPDRSTVAALRLRFADSPSVRWDPAEVDENGELYVRGVDAGVIMIGDMDDLRRAGPDLGPELDAGLMASIDAPEQYQLRTLPGGGSYVATTAGLGDGAYPVWWGFDADGAVTEVIVEFDVLVRNTWAELDVPIEQLRRPGPLVTPETEVAGVTLEVLGPERAADEWNAVRNGVDPSHDLDPDQIFAALRRSGRATTDIALVDGDGVTVSGGGATMGPVGDDSQWLEVWSITPEIERATTAHVRIFQGLVPLEAP